MFAPIHHSFNLVSLCHVIRLVLSCLLSLMTTLEERFSTVEARIEGYEAKLDAATLKPGRKDTPISSLATRNQITALLQQQQQQGE